MHSTVSTSPTPLANHDLNQTLSIAIIVRTKDRPHLLTRSLQSLAEQTRLPEEVIVVNDGGIAIEEVIQRFANLKIHLLNNDTNHGRAQAGNQGVEIARSEVIGFLDDDDRFLPDHLQRLETAILHFDAKIAYSGCRLLQRDMLGDKVILREQAIGEFNDAYAAERLHYENYIPLINLLINRNLWLDVGGFDETFEVFEDWDVLLRLSSRTPFYHVDRITTEYSIWGSSQITQATDKQRWLNAYRQFLGKHLIPLPDSKQLNYLTEYWRINQERRGILRETTEDKRSLQLKLIHHQQTVAEAQRHLAEYKDHYTQLQREHAQLQTDWTRKYEQLQTDYAKLQSDWSAKYELSQTDWHRKHEQLQTEYVQIQTEWRRKYEQLQTEYAKAQSEWANKQEQLQADWGRKYEQLQVEDTRVQAEWRNKYEQLQSEWSRKYEQLQIDWDRKYEQLQVDWSRKYEQLQADWSRKYEQLQAEDVKVQAEWRNKYEELQAAQTTELAQLHSDWRNKYKQLEAEKLKQYAQLQSAWHQQEAHFKQQQTDMLQEIDKNIALYQQLQTATQQDRECCQTFQKSLQEMYHQLALGLTQTTLERVLASQSATGYLTGVSPDNLRWNYQRLVEWVEQQQQTWGEEKRQQEEQFQQQLVAVHHELQEQVFLLQEESILLRQSLRNLTNKAVKSRWLHYGGYVKALDYINLLAERVDTQVENLSLKPSKSLKLQKTKANLRSLEAPKGLPLVAEIPPPRPLSGFQPSVRLFAGDSTQLQLMAHVTEKGYLPFPLGPTTAFVFTMNCHLPNFCRLDIALATYLRINVCHLRVILREVGQPTPVRVIRVNGMAVLDNLFHPITFEPIVDSAGKTYQIEIDSPDANDQNALAVWCYEIQPPLQLTQPVTTETAIPITLPSWLQQGFFDAPLSSRLSDPHGEHLFMITGKVTDLLSLQIFLRRLDRMLDVAKTTGQVVICGEVQEEIKDYCTQHQLHILETLPAKAGSPVNIAAGLTILPAKAGRPVSPVVGLSEYAESSGKMWLCDLRALPQPDAIQRANDVFTARPSTAVIVPLQVQTNGTISAAYSLLDQYGTLHHLPIGAPANHPHHGYRRVIDAASSTLVVIKKQCLKQLDNEVLGKYHTPLYQLTDLIWQLKTQQWDTVYEASLCYQVDQPLVSLDTSQYEADRQLFLTRWQTQLVAQTRLLVSHYALLNPKQLPSILIIDATLPAYDEDSGSLRLFTLMKMLVTLGYQVTFFPDNLDSNFKYCHALEALGVEVFHAPYNITEALSYRNFTFAIVSRVTVGHRYLPFLRLISPQTKIFYDTVDIHYIRELRQAEIENHPQLAQKAQETKRKELSNCLLADCTITVTEEDARHLQQELPHLNYAVLPNVHLLQPLPATTFEERDGLVFIGNYNHRPNEDAVYFFVENVLPKIHAQLPDVCLYVIGSNMKEPLKTLANERVKIVGWVDQVEPELAKRRVFVSYLRYGAGMKGKLGQALSLGLPVVTTTIGAEGMGLIAGETALIADAPAQFAEEVCRLYTDKVLWEKLSQQGRDYIEQHFGETAVRERLRNLLK